MYSSKWFRRGGWIVFFLWHLVFVLVALAILLPYITLPIVNSVRIGAAPYHYGFYAMTMVLVPFLSLIIVMLKFRRDVVAALKLFYGVEVPLLLLLVLRVALFRDVPLPGQLLLCNVWFGIAAYFCILWYRNIPVARPVKYLDLFLSTIVAMVGIYLGLLLGLQFFPFFLSLSEKLWQAVVQVTWSDITEFFSLITFKPFVILTVLLLGMTTFFFLTTPVVLLYLYLSQYLQRIRMTSRLCVATVLLIVLTTEGVIFNLAGPQPQHLAFGLTQSLPKTAEEQKALVSRNESIKKGLLNAYLSSYRYISTTESSRFVKKLYTETFWDESSVPDLAQKVFNLLASPFLYQGPGFEKDQQLAALRYQEFFDTPIEKGERQAILHAVKATWENEQNEAGLMNAASHYVHLKEQFVEVVEQGDLATVTITQILLNQTFQPQEAVFHFSLPDDAVITGLWLSDNINTPEKFRHVVSPRGAAQAVYKAEVNRRVDPALLEQVGPVQYRLRAFPIPPRVVDNKNSRNRYGDTFKGYTVAPAVVRFQYVVGIDRQGRWAMPQLLEKRNVYWNDQTIRSYETKEPDQWLPVSVEAGQSVPPSKHETNILNKQIIAVPYFDNDTASVASQFAVIIDGSYSMNSMRDRVAEQIQEIENTNISADIFFCQDVCREISGMDALQLSYFGNGQLLNHLQQWSKSTSKSLKRYSAVFVLTDSGSYELSPERTDNFSFPNQPLWLVHLSEKLPYAYSDTVIDWLNDSNGGVARSFEEAKNGFLWNQRIGEEMKPGRFIGKSSNYLWYVSERNPDKRDENLAFKDLAASRLIQYTAANSDKTELSELDYIHNIAKVHDIVSYFSSMLVLVEDRQRQLLEAAESADDRFSREIETGEETLGKSADAFGVPGVPEPEEWALLIVVTCLLIVALWRRFQYRISNYSHGS